MTRHTGRADLPLHGGRVPARTVEALAHVAEVIHGAPARFSDPARFALAHGGKDGHPFPVPLKVYDETIRVLTAAVGQARLGSSDRLAAIQRLAQPGRPPGLEVGAADQSAESYNPRRASGVVLASRVAENMSPMTSSPRLRTFLHNNGLSLTVTAMFVIFMVGQTLTGHAQLDQERRDHGLPPVSLAQYLQSGHFMEATAENWESEFLQMAFYVWLTSFLLQKGSSESRKIGEAMPVDRDPRLYRNKKTAPWPVRKGGLALSLYQYSLSYAFVLLFLVSLGFHAAGGARAYSAAQVQHGGPPISIVEYLATSQFWFESFQNWQSEFLSLMAMVVLSIFLRHRGSPESKPVDAAHGETGD